MLERTFAEHCQRPIEHDRRKRGATTA
jgi:hypothetical protein